MNDPYKYPREKIDEFMKEKMSIVTAEQLIRQHEGPNAKPKSYLPYSLRKTIENNDDFDKLLEKLWFYMAIDAMDGGCSYVSNVQYSTLDGHILLEGNGLRTADKKRIPVSTRSFI